MKLLFSTCSKALTKFVEPTTKFCQMMYFSSFGLALFHIEIAHTEHLSGNGMSRGGRYLVLLK